MLPDEWPAPLSSAYMEAVELIYNEPWEDFVNLPNGCQAAPTFKALNQIQANLNTSKQWKAWATLYLRVPSMIELSSVQATLMPGVRGFLCPTYGWIFLVKAGKIIDVRAVHVGE
ncbi:hypothetical protein AGMMS50256_05970 [Betaproteobacteria bacterium]|nr:hypothetical protein AGMMS50256_05970 [Betaproteobacteria bacterium]